MTGTDTYLALIALTLGSTLVIECIETWHGNLDVVLAYSD
jgi:hypothetical protein